jgi:predicted metal-dependent hydrolase
MIVGGTEIAIFRSNRKTVSIYIERDGSVSALVPDSIDDSNLQEVLDSKSYQIHQKLAEWEDLNTNKVERKYVNGQSFLYLGRNYQLKVADDAKGLSFSKGRFTLASSELDNAKELFRQFYQKKLSAKLEPIIERYKSEIGVRPKSYRIIDLQNRWASCTSDDKLNFHWKCAMAPIDVLNYIVVHELTHLIHKNHSPEFWNELDKVMPNYQRHVHWLKVNGAGMDL